MRERTEALLGGSVKDMGSHLPFLLHKDTQERYR